MDLVSLACKDESEVSVLPRPAFFSNGSSPFDYFSRHENSVDTGEIVDQKQRL